MQFLKKNISCIYKFLIRAIFKFIYGKIVFSTKAKYSSSVKIYKINHKKIRYSKKKKYAVFQINNGRIYTDFVQNVAFIDKNRIINEVSYQQINGNLKKANFNSTLKIGTPYIKKKYNGNILSLTQGASGHTNYFHWLFDILPKIKIFSEKFNLNEIDYFYVSELLDYQKTTLKILGLHNQKIIDPKHNRHVTGDKIFSVEHPWYHKGFIHDENFNLPSWIVDWQKKKFLPHKKKFSSRKKIFIDRSESKYAHSQIINNDEIKNYLKKNGFGIYKVGKLSFQNQIHLFNNAEVIIGAHGAAFANLSFCKPNTKIIEFKSNSHPSLVDKRISKINNLKFHMIKTPKIKNKNLLGDIYIDPKKLDKILSYI